MCGILAIIDPLHKYSQLDFEKLNLIQRHRGPEAEGVIYSNNTYLGSTRLKIHDLDDSANQPMADCSGRYAIIFNGAIYNYRKIRTELVALGHKFKTNSDTEVILYAYIEWNSGLLLKLQGMFSFCILDKNKNKLFVARDALGVKPLHLYVGNGILILSSEIKPILNSKKFVSNVNRNSLADLFLYQSPSPNETFFSGVDLFPQGHYAEIDCCAVSKPIFTCFWDISDRKGDTAISSDEFEGYLLQTLGDAWQGDKRIGLQLSGGVDSSLIAALASDRLSIPNIRTYSAIFSNKERRYSLPKSEESFVDMVVSKFGLYSSKYTYSSSEIKTSLLKAIESAETPLHGASTAVYYLLARSIKQEVDVVVTGEGVDDIFNGYTMGCETTNSLESFLPTFSNRSLVKKMLGKNYSDNRLAYSDILNRRCRKNCYTNEEILSAITTSYGLPNLLARHDRMFMASSIEGRPVFADKLFFDLRMRMPEALIRRGGEGKVVFKGLLNKYFDNKFVFRKKIGFSSPYGDWLSDQRFWGDYWGLIDYDILSQYFNIDIVRSMVDMKDDAGKWSGENLNFLMCLIGFQVWHDCFINPK
jgi:asparagine synthase (glutamine-hydrolysing)